jgi:NAD(P)-dependent dehydrogenase (short-subunit alcohol dehydrogenase family)
MKGKIVLVTGSSSGIGFETAKALAQQGAEVILVARSEEKLKEAAAVIKAATGNDKLKYYTADFSSQKSIRELAAKVKKDYTKLDVLVNNAGGVFPEFKLSEDGLEMTIATNHFAYFLLTNLLLDLLKKADSARIVNVASGSHYQGKIDFESFKKKKSYFIMKAYGQSKLANVLFTKELAERLKGTRITVNCVHPGFVHTGIGTKGVTGVVKFIWTFFSRLGGLSAEEGAKTSVYLASSSAVNGVTGKYFDKCKPKEESKLAKDINLQHELWKVSEQLCPIN